MDPVKRVWKEGGDIVLVLLRLTSASADIFPPLQNAAGCALHIAEMAKNFKSNQKNWTVFSQYVQYALANVIKSLPDVATPRDEIKLNMETLRGTLVEITQEIQALQDKSPVRRVWTFTKDPDKIDDMRKRLDDALALFQLKATLNLTLDVAKVLERLDVEQHLRLVINKLNDKIVAKIDLSILPYAKGASWNPSLVCLTGTRKALMEEILNWVDAIDLSTNAEIFMLVDVAGAGKTALAHTVAQHCYEQGRLGSSFFFDRETAGRNGPQELFSTMARDLASLSTDLAEHIAQALERDPSLATAPPSRQFKNLILDLSRWFPVNTKIVIVIDALDEGYDAELLKLFRDEIPKLPATFRIFLTSRSNDDVEFFLSRQSHIRLGTLNINGQTNRNDIKHYVKYRLKEIAERKHLDENWPGECLSNGFIARAEGLFIWVSTVSGYLLRLIEPTEQLRLLLSNDSQSGLRAEGKMDELYSTILGTCNWEDEAFVVGYGLLMGAIMAAKTPLSISALQSLLGTTLIWSAATVLRPLGSLLTGLTGERQPVRILHLSFRDFLTTRARSSPERMRFYLDEKHHSQRLALLCLVILNEKLKHSIPGTGYLSESVSDMYGVPPIGDVSEELWYACKFWIDHLLDVETPATHLIDMLRSFLSTRVVLWVEVTTSKGRFHKLLEVRRWLQNTLPEEKYLIDTIFSPGLAPILNSLSTRLSLGRRDEALHAIEEAVELCRWFSINCPATFNPGLVTSLNSLANRLSDLGRREEALYAVEEAVELCRQRASNCPATINPHLAASLCNIASLLSRLGRREEALQASEDAVELYRQLAADDHATFDHELAYSFNTLAKCLQLLGRRDGALQAVEEAAQMYRRLAADNPATFNPNLAYSLNNLAKCLSHLGRREEALPAEMQAIDIYRPLVADKPATFTPNLAYSLNNLAKDLSHLRRQDEALRCVEEAVEIYRPLANDLPATFNPNLAYSLNNLAKCFSHLGRLDDALQAVEEAVELRRQLAADRPAAFTQDVAISLNNLAGRLFDLGRHHEALVAIEEAVELHRRLATDHPAKFSRDLAESLNILARCLCNLGRREDSLLATEEASRLESI